METKTTIMALIVVAAISAAYYAGHAQNQKTIQDIASEIESLRQEAEASPFPSGQSSILFITSLEGNILSVSEESIAVRTDEGRGIIARIVANKTRIAKSIPLAQEDYDKIRKDFDAWLAAKKQNDSSFPDIKAPLPEIDTLLGVSDLKPGDFVRVSAGEHIGDAEEFVAVEIRLLR